MGLVPFAVTMFFDNFYLSIAGLFFEYVALHSLLDRNTQFFFQNKYIDNK